MWKSWLWVVILQSKLIYTFFQQLCTVWVPSLLDRIFGGKDTYYTLLNGVIIPSVRHFMHCWDLNYTFSIIIIIALTLIFLL